MKPIKESLKYDPPWLWALITGMLSLLLIYLLVGLLNFVGISPESHGETGNYVAHLITGLLIAYICYSISKTHPNGFWYILILCNLTTIGIALDPSNNQDIYNMITLGIGWTLSIVGSLVGALKGKRKAKTE